WDRTENPGAEGPIPSLPTRADVAQRLGLSRNGWSLEVVHQPVKGARVRRYATRGTRAALISSTGRSVNTANLISCASIGIQNRFASSSSSRIGSTRLRSEEHTSELQSRV